MGLAAEPLHNRLVGHVGGKIEVIEFFWYGCPHCNALEPAIVDWVKRLPADVQAILAKHFNAAALKERDDIAQAKAWAMSCLAVCW